MPASALEGAVGPAPRQTVGAQSYPAFALDYVTALSDAKARLAAFRAVSQGANPLAASIEDTVLLSESSAFLTNPVAGERFIDAGTRAIKRVYDRITLAGSTVTLTSKSGILPVTIRNTAGFPVRVVVRFVTDRRLVFTNGFSQNVVIPSALQTLTFHVRAQATGRFPIKIQLLDANSTNVSSLSISVHAVSVTLASNSAPGALESVGNANPDNDFRYDASLNGFIFNLSTKALTTGTWQLNFSLSGDPIPHAVQFGVR